MVKKIRVCWPWSHGLRPKKLYASVAVPLAPVRVPSQWPLAPSVTSVMSVANDKGDNEMIPGLCTDLLVFALRLRKSPENLSQETSHRLKWGPLSPNKVSRIAQQVTKEKQERTEKKSLTFPHKKELLIYMEQLCLLGFILRI